MKITDLHVDGFGIWRDLSMNELSDRVTVVYGENEAGKTTLMHFVRTVLYGFSPERRDRYLPPVQGGTPGGRMTIALPHGRYRVRRFANGAAGPGDVEITSVDGSYQSCHQLATLLGGIDEPIFNNVFAVGLHEIQQLATLNDTQAAQHLYDLTTGLDRVSLFEVMRELATSRQRILSDDERPSQLLQLHAKRQQLEEELRLLHARTTEWVQLAGQVRASNEEIGQLEQRSTALERETRLVEIACNVHDPWRQRAEIDARLTALGTLAEIPLEDLESLERVTGQIVEYRTQVGEIKRRRQALREQADAVDLNEKLWRQRARVEALVEQQPWITSLNDQIGRLEEEILELDSELTAEQRQFGIKRGGALAAAIPQLSKENLAKLREPLREIREHKQRLTDAQREVQQHQERAEEIRQQFESELASRGVRSLSEAMERCGQQVSQARHQAQADDRVHKLFRQRDEIQQQCQMYMDRQVLPIRALVGLGVLFTAGSVLIMTALLFKVFAFTGATAGVLAVMGVGALMLTGAIKFGFEQVAGRQLDECRRQEELIQKQIERATGEHGSGSHGGRAGDREVDGPVQAAEREMAALEALVPLESDRERALQDAEAAQSKIRHAEDAYQTARGRWRSNLRSLGLPENLSPKEVKGFAGAWRVLGEKQQRINGRREELEQRQADLAAVSSRASQLLLEAGIQPKSPHLVDRIDQLADVLSRQRELAERRDELLKESRAIRREQQRHQTAGRKLMRSRREMLRRLGVDRAQTTKDLPERLKEIRERRETREQLTSKIAASMGVVCSEEDLAGHVSGATEGQLEKRLESLLSQYDGTTDQLKKLYERRGQTTQQMNNLANDRRLAEVQLELSCVQQKIGEAVRQWQALGVISLLLEEIRALYETDRQPETLREASGYLIQLTRGRYTRIWTPLGDNVLKVDDEASHALPVEYLSRGTREQVYLSLRLALVAAYARRGILLPLVLDDVLVNFDARRAEVAAKVLGEFAKAGHQILVFTCHEHIMEIFQRLGVEVRQLPSNARGANVIAAPPVESRAIEPPVVVAEEPIEEEEDYEEEVMEEPEEEEEEIVDEEDEDELDLADDDLEVHEGEFEFSSQELELPDDAADEEELVEVEEELEAEEEPIAEPVLLEITDEPPEEPAEEPEADYASDETEWEEFDEGDDEEYEYIDDEEAARRLAWAEVTDWEEEEAAAGDEDLSAEETDGAEAA